MTKCREAGVFRRSREVTGNWNIAFLHSAIKLRMYLERHVKKGNAYILGTKNLHEETIYTT